MRNLTKKCSTAKNNYFLYLIILQKPVPEIPRFWLLVRYGDNFTETHPGENLFFC